MLRWITKSSLIVRPCRLLSSAKSSPLSPLWLRWLSSFHHPSHRSTPLPLLLLRWRCYSDDSTKKCNTNIECDTDDDQRKEEEGEKLYNLAAEALRNANEVKHIREEKLLQEQYDAAEKGRTKTQQRKERHKKSLFLPPEDNNDAKKDRAAGMAVIRTIVEQTRASNDAVVRVEKWNTGKDDEIVHSQQMNDEEYWHKMARLHMEESALRYGYGPALVRLGNDALDHARKGEDDSSASSPSASSFVDRDRCMGWRYESRVRRLELILEITNSESLSYLELAKHLYEEAGEHGSPEGLYNLGHILWDEDETVSAMDAFHAAMTIGDSDAIYFVATQYLSYEEDDGVTSFLPQVYERYGLEYVSSTLRLDTMTMTMTPPLSLVNDLQQHGYVLLHHAVHNHGHGPATHHLALLCNQNGDTNEFCRLLSLAAYGGNPDSLFLRGHCYYFGTDGHTRDMSLAFADFIAAADSGSIDAMVSAGAMLHQGVRSDDGMTIIVDRDQQRAFELYQRAGELGSIEGWRNVVSCYATGEGVKKCIDTAKYIANTMLKDDR